MHSLSIKESPSWSGWTAVLAWESPFRDQKIVMRCFRVTKKETEDMKAEVVYFGWQSMGCTND